MIFQGGRFELLEDGASPCWAAPSLLTGSAHIRDWQSSAKAPARLCPGSDVLRCHFCLPERPRGGDRLPELLHAALHHHEPPNSQEPESCLLLLQRSHQDASHRPHGRCSHTRQVGERRWAGAAAPGTGQLSGQFAARLAALHSLGWAGRGAGLIPRAVRTQIRKDLPPGSGLRG